MTTLTEEDLDLEQLLTEELQCEECSLNPATWLGKCKFCPNKSPACTPCVENFMSYNAMINSMRPLLGDRNGVWYCETCDTRAADLKDLVDFIKI